MDRHDDRTLIVSRQAVADGSLLRDLTIEGFELSVVDTFVALEHALLTRPPYALLELRIGERSAFDALQLVKARALPCKVIILTSYGSAELARLAILEGASDFLTKPASAKQLRAAFREETYPDVVPDVRPLDAVRMAYVEEVMGACGSVTQAAHALGVDRHSLRRMLERFAARSESGSAIHHWWSRRRA
ncbi:MAG: hypothetical protein RJA70_2236 [Pseudomonadota bacterium]|jgi:ActR/RegA family two-component response regulator